MDRVRTAQNSVMNSLLQLARLDRMVEQAALEPAAYTPIEFLTAIRARHLERARDAGEADRRLPPEHAARLYRHARQPAQRAAEPSDEVRALVKGELRAARATIVAAIPVGDRSGDAPASRGLARSDRHRAGSAGAARPCGGAGAGSRTRHCAGLGRTRRRYREIRLRQRSVPRPARRMLDGSAHSVMNSLITGTYLAPCLIVALLSVAGCTEQPPVTGPTPPPSAPLPVAPPKPIAGTMLDISLNGIATSETGTPLGAIVVSAYFRPAQSGLPSSATATTDADGSYRLRFTARVGGYGGATALLSVRREGYEADQQWFQPETSSDNYTFSPVVRRFTQIAPGESAEVTVSRTDPVCSSPGAEDWAVSYNLNCRTIQIVTPAAGMLTVQAVSQGGEPPAGLQFGIPCCWGFVTGNLESLPVEAGSVVFVIVYVSGAATNRTFVVSSSLAQPDL